MADDRTSSPKPAPVGYGNPPTETRFRKGQSGNPAGRAKGGSNGLLSTRLKVLLREEASRPIKVCIHGEDITLPAEQAAIRALAASAARGQLRAQAIFLKLISAAEQDEAADEHVLDEARD
jgi:hypothetical protein